MSADTSAADTSAYNTSSSNISGDSPYQQQQQGGGGGGRRMKEHMANLFNAGYTTASATQGAADRRYMSYSDLQHLSSQQHDEVLFLRNENNNLKAREIEISSLSVKLQQQFAATQSQIDHLKSTVRLQLLNPITEGEYLKIEEKAESDRDLLDTLKLGIYQQIGSLKASKDTAVRKASELSLEVEKLSTALRSAKQDMSDAQYARENDATELKRMKVQMEHKTNLELEHMSKIKDLEHRLSGVTNEQERSIDARVQLQHKINEVARLEMLLRQEEGSLAKHKASLDCAEQKLDILKSEYYDLKLSYSQKVLTLENALRTAEEKLTLVADVELEAEVFIANMATREEAVVGGGGGDGTGSSSTTPLAVIPPSRRMAHALTITKKCLALENKLAASEHELRHKDDVIAKLTQSLAMAKSALSAHQGGGGGGSGSGAGAQYTLIEQTVDRLMADKASLEARNKVLLDENTVLTQQVKDQSADLKVLTRHREELVLIREQLAQYAAALAGGGGGGGGGAARGGGGGFPLSTIDLNAKPTGSIMKGGGGGSGSMNNNSGSVISPLIIAASSSSNNAGGGGGNTSPNNANYYNNNQNFLAVSGGGGNSGGNSVRFASTTGGGGGGGSMGSFNNTAYSTAGNYPAGGGGNSGGGGLGAAGGSGNALLGHSTAGGSALLGGGGGGRQQYNSFNPELNGLVGGGGGITAASSRPPSGGIQFNVAHPHPLLQNLNNVIIRNDGGGGGGGGGGHNSLGGASAATAAPMMIIQPPTPSPSAPASFRMTPHQQQGIAAGLRVRPESHPEIPFCQSIVIQ